MNRSHLKFFLAPVAVFLLALCAMGEPQPIGSVIYFETDTLDPTTGVRANPDSGTITWSAHVNGAAGSIANGSMASIGTGLFGGSITVGSGSASSNDEVTIRATATFSGTAYSGVIARHTLFTGDQIANANRQLFAMEGTRRYWVTKAGNDTTGIGSPELPYLTIQKAIDVAVAAGAYGAKITVGVGTFIEDIYWEDVGLTIEGLSPTDTILINNTDTVTMLVGNADGTVLRNLTVTNDEGNSAIDLAETSSHCLVEDCITSGGTDTIIVRGSFNTIRRTSVAGTWDGILIADGVGHTLDTVDVLVDGTQDSGIRTAFAVFVADDTESVYIKNSRLRAIRADSAAGDTAGIYFTPQVGIKPYVVIENCPEITGQSTDAAGTGLVHGINVADSDVTVISIGSRFSASNAGSGTTSAVAVTGRFVDIGNQYATSSGTLTQVAGLDWSKFTNATATVSLTNTSTGTVSQGGTFQVLAGTFGGVAASSVAGSIETMGTTVASASDEFGAAEFYANRRTGSEVASEARLVSVDSQVTTNGANVGTVLSHVQRALPAATFGTQGGLVMLGANAGTHSFSGAATFTSGIVGNVTGNLSGSVGTLSAFGGDALTLTNAIKSVTDKLNTALEQDGAAYRFTSNAIELAPTGAGDASEAKQDRIIRLLGGAP